MTIHPPYAVNNYAKVPGARKRHEFFPFCDLSPAWTQEALQSALALAESDLADTRANLQVILEDLEKEGNGSGERVEKARRRLELVRRLSPTVAVWRYWPGMPPFCRVVGVTVPFHERVNRKLDLERAWRSSKT